MAKAIPSAAALDLAGEPALTVATGDSVMVDSGSAVPYIGHVKALFSRLDGVQKAKWRVEEDTGPFMLLQWYYRDSDLPARLRGRSSRSLVLAPNHKDMASVQCVMKVLRMFRAPDVLPAESTLPDNVYFCRGTYWGGDAIIPLHRNDLPLWHQPATVLSSTSGGSRTAAGSGMRGPDTATVPPARAAVPSWTSGDSSAPSVAFPASATTPSSAEGNDTRWPAMAAGMGTVTANVTGAGAGEAPDLAVAFANSMASGPTTSPTPEDLTADIPSTDHAAPAAADPVLDVVPDRLAGALTAEAGSARFTVAGDLTPAAAAHPTLLAPRSPRQPPLPSDSEMVRQEARSPVSSPAAAATPSPGQAPVLLGLKPPPLRHVTALGPAAFRPTSPSTLAAPAAAPATSPHLPAAAPVHQTSIPASCSSSAFAAASVTAALAGPVWTSPPHQIAHATRPTPVPAGQPTAASSSTTTRTITVAGASVRPASTSASAAGGGAGQSPLTGTTLGRGSNATGMTTADLRAVGGGTVRQPTTLVVRPAPPRAGRSTAASAVASAATPASAVPGTMRGAKTLTPAAVDGEVAVTPTAALRCELQLSLRLPSLTQHTSAYKAPRIGEAYQAELPPMSVARQPRRWRAVPSAMSPPTAASGSAVATGFIAAPPSSAAAAVAAEDPAHTQSPRSYWRRETMPAADVDAFLRFVRLHAPPLCVGMRLGAPHPFRTCRTGRHAGAMRLPRLWPAVLVCWTPQRLSTTPGTMPGAPLVAPVLNPDEPPPPGFAQVAFFDLATPVQVPLSTLVPPCDARLVTDERALELLYLCGGDTVRALIAVSQEASNYSRIVKDRLSNFIPPASFSAGRSALAGFAEVAVLPPLVAGHDAPMSTSCLHASELRVWGKAEQQMFARGLARFGKHFRYIAVSMQASNAQLCKTGAQCTAFYYRLRGWRRFVAEAAGAARTGWAAGVPPTVAAVYDTTTLAQKRPRAAMSQAERDSGSVSSGSSSGSGAGRPAVPGAGAESWAGSSQPRGWPARESLATLMCVTCGQRKGGSQVLLCSNPQCRAAMCEVCMRRQHALELSAALTCER